MIDGYLAALDKLGAVVVATADHGMNDKHDAESKAPNVVYLQSILDEWVGKGKTRVILPITDPYVAHHGALGSFATVHVPAGARRRRPDEADQGARRHRCAYCRRRKPASASSCLRDRIGDIVVTSTRYNTIGTARDKHDLSGLDEPLRSHGGLTEQRVPMIANRRLKLQDGHRLRNFDVFDVALNRTI